MQLMRQAQTLNQQPIKIKCWLCKVPYLVEQNLAAQTLFKGVRRLFLHIKVSSDRRYKSASEKQLHDVLCGCEEVYSF